jgi:hypothetical protein
MIFSFAPAKEQKRKPSPGGSQRRDIPVAMRRGTFWFNTSWLCALLYKHEKKAKKGKKEKKEGKRKTPRSKTRGGMVRCE